MQRRQSQAQLVYTTRPLKWCVDTLLTLTLYRMKNTSMTTVFRTRKGRAQKASCTLFLRLRMNVLLQRMGRGKVQTLRRWHGTKCVGTSVGVQVWGHKCGGGACCKHARGGQAWGCHCGVQEWGGASVDDQV